MVATLAVIAVSLLVQDRADATKVDQGLDGPGRLSVFVRMTDQVFKTGADYVTFCTQNKNAKRRALRTELIAQLQAKSEASWKLAAATVARLEKSGALAAVTRTWIVNGFFADASSKACTELAKLDAVGFVYRQRVVQQQHLRSRPSGVRARALLARVAEDWTADQPELPIDELQVPWNLKRIRAPEAWRTSTGKGVVVALFDTGLTPTPALLGALWKNPKETLDGKDEDANGYVDDVFGWDFMGNHNAVLGDGRGHGSMCAGIVAGRPYGKNKIVTGVAPGARVMVVRGMGFLKAYEYALATGADVVSMSYMWVNRPLGNYRGVYRLAHEHLTAAGVVSVGGAGNFARSAPRGKQIALPKDIPCVIAAAGIVKSGDIAGPSSRGPCSWAGVAFYDDYPEDDPLIKPDVTGCFGGYPVWAPPTFGRRRVRVTLRAENAALIVGPRGNSFSGPHAAGVAALMLEANPDLPAWRVKALMEATCKDLGDKGRDVVYGAGLLQADKAVAAARAAR